LKEEDDGLKKEREGEDEGERKDEKSDSMRVIVRREMDFEG
jgi:hypothetical protein